MLNITDIRNYPCTTENVHTTGVTIVHCHMLSYRQAYVLDDFGLLCLANIDSVMFALFSSVDH